MTVGEEKRQRAIRNGENLPALGAVWEKILTLLLLSVLLSTVFLSEEIAAAVRLGLTLCARTVIPAVFPFMILSGIVTAFSSFDSLSLVARPFERIFHIHRCGIGAFFTGIFCGFPLGVKCTVDLYRAGRLEKDEAERLIGFSNNTGPAFLVSAIGIGMRGSMREGVLLYLAMVLSAIIVGILFGIGHRAGNGGGVREQKEFDLVTCIRDAGVNTLAVASFLTFFSVVTGLLSHFLPNGAVLSFLFPFLEVGNAAYYLAALSPLPARLTLALTAFATSFSGLSVHLQAGHFLSGSGLSVRRYYPMKLFQGLLAAGIVFLLA
ncbi:MAG TPA: hypothetical protein DDY70_05700 [Clostridiales bacterium]|nr:hypothetical protein [Clostridiales bacterium]